MGDGRARRNGKRDIRISRQELEQSGGIHVRAVGGASSKSSGKLARSGRPEVGNSGNSAMDSGTTKHVNPLPDLGRMTGEVDESSTAI